MIKHVLYVYKRGETRVCVAVGILERAQHLDAMQHTSTMKKYEKDTVVVATALQVAWAKSPQSPNNPIFS